MACTTGITKAITSTCDTQPVAGLEAVAYLWKRGDMTISYDATNPSKVTGIVPVGAALAYKLTGFKKNINAGHDIVVAEDSADTYKHFFSFKGYEFAADDVSNIDGLGDICVVTEYKQKGALGVSAFKAYGI